MRGDFCSIHNNDKTHDQKIVYTSFCTKYLINLVELFSYTFTAGILLLRRLVNLWPIIVLFTVTDLRRR